MTTSPRIMSAASLGRHRLGIGWRDGHGTVVDLGGWIKTGGEILAPLMDPRVFFDVEVAADGSFVYWQDPDADLSIDAVHLQMLGEEQAAFTTADLVAWQAVTGFSNQEAADFLQVALSTWNGYKAGSRIPAVVGIVLRATQRDPLLMQAHYRPRVAGRPRQEAEAPAGKR